MTGSDKVGTEFCIITDASELSTEWFCCDVKGSDEVMAESLAESSAKPDSTENSDSQDECEGSIMLVDKAEGKMLPDGRGGRDMSSSKDKCC